MGLLLHYRFYPLWFSERLGPGELPQNMLNWVNRVKVLKVCKLFATRAVRLKPNWTNVGFLRWYFSTVWLTQWNILMSHLNKSHRSGGNLTHFRQKIWHPCLLEFLVRLVFKSFRAHFHMYAIRKRNTYFILPIFILVLG